MCKAKLPVRGARRLTVITAALIALTSSRAQTAAAPAGGSPAATESLAPYVTTATRTPAAPQALGSDVDSVSAADLAAQQVTTMAGALAAAAGAPMFASGARGATTSLFLRGANSNQTLFLVDGIRLNDPNTDYQVFLAGASLGAGDRLEIARGPQSTLYGAEAIGGVITLNAERGAGAPASLIEVEGGSFGTVNGTLATQGADGPMAWNVSASGAHTDNARPNNQFDAANIVVRLDRQVTTTMDVGTTVRWFRGVLGSPSDRFTNDPNNVERESNLLATAFATLQPTPEWNARVTVGGQDRRYIDDTPAPNPPYDLPAAKTIVTNRRGVCDAQASYAGLERNRITVGATGETEQTRNTGFGAIDRHQTQGAVYAEDEYSAGDALFLTAGLRTDHFDTYGSVTTGRATAAWLPLPRTLKLRASYGTGFRSPSFLDLYGQDPYYVGNPNLSPERNRSVDAGVDCYLPANRGTVSATWFNSEFTDLIQSKFNPFPQPSTVQNIGRARTRGAELSLRVRLPADMEVTGSYTYLEALALSSFGNTELLRRPRHQLSLDAHRAWGAGVTAGAAVQYVGRRADVDAQTFATILDGGFTVARAYASWQATPRLALNARVENALARRYEPVNGYPALGFGAFAGAEYRF